MVKEIDEYKWEKVPEDDPNRCQASAAQGQCPNKAVEGSKFCMCHGGHKAAARNKEERMKNYRLGKFHARAAELGNSDGINSLRDEVALLRMLIEEKIKFCKDEHDLLLISGPISDLIIKVEKVVSSMNKLEDKLGNTLNKEKIIQFAQLMIEIIGRYIENPETLDAIGEDFFAAMEKI